MNCIVDCLDRSVTGGDERDGEGVKRKQTGKENEGGKATKKHDVENDYQNKDLEEDMEENLVIPHTANTFGVRFDEDMAAVFPSSAFWEISTEDMKAELAEEEARREGK